MVPWGGGTRIGVGNVPSSYDIALDLTGFTAHLEHVAGDLTVIVDSGVRVPPRGRPPPRRKEIGGRVLHAGLTRNGLAAALHRAEIRLLGDRFA